MLLSFKPKVDNTQLVKGNAIIDRRTGRVITCHAEGEYDMLRFELDTDTGDKEHDKLAVKSCILRTTFKFMGNQMAATYRVNYDLSPVDSAKMYHSKPAFTINLLRKIALHALKEKYLKPVFLADIRQDTVRTQPDRPRGMFWRKLGDYLVDRIGSDFGKSNQGYFRLNASLRPFYMEYSPSRGFTYMNDFRLGYTFGPRTSCSFSLRQDISFARNALLFMRHWCFITTANATFTRDSN